MYKFIAIGRFGRTVAIKQSWPPLNGHTNRRVNNRAHVKQDMSK